MLSVKQGGIKDHFWVFGITWREMEIRSSGPLANILLIIYNAYKLAFVCLHFVLSDTRVLNSLEDLCFALVSAVNSFDRVLKPREGNVYTVVHRQRVSLYLNSSVWLDTQGLSTRFRPPPSSDVCDSLKIPVREFIYCEWSLHLTQSTFRGSCRICNDA